LLELEKIYEQHTKYSRRHSEIDRTVLALRELSKWSQRAESLKKAIENHQLDSVYQDLVSLESELSALERKAPMLAVLPKMRDQLLWLQHSATSACSDVWARSISVYSDGESTTLTISQSQGHSYTFEADGSLRFGLLQHGRVWHS